MSTEVVLVADLGGTRWRAAARAWEASPDTHHWLRRLERPAPQHDYTAALVALLRDVQPAHTQVRAIGLAVAAFVDAHQGRLLHAPNLPGWHHVPLAAEIGRLWRVPVHLLNDANAAALGEAYAGAGRGYDPLLFVTVSTGVGGGLVHAGRLWAGAHGLAGEIGHWTVDPTGPRCSCGGRGHVEAFASGWALAQQARAHTGRPWEAREVAAAAAAGQTWAQHLLRAAAAVVGRVLADACHLLDPAAVVIGGGVSRSGPMWWQALRQAYREQLVHPAWAVPLLPAALGEDAGLHGAALAARYPQRTGIAPNNEPTHGQPTA